MSRELHPFVAVLLQGMRALHRAAALLIPVWDPEEATLAQLHLDEITRRLDPPLDDTSPVTGEQLMGGPAWNALLSELLGLVARYEAGLRYVRRGEDAEEILRELAAARGALEAAIADIRQRGG